MSRTAPTTAEFIARFPEFAEIAAGVINAQLSFSERLLDVDAWDDFFSDAVAFDSAHNLFLSQLASGSAQGAAQGAVGPVTSTSAAGVSVSFATSSPEGKNASADWYLKTVYGQQFLRLQRLVLPLGLLAL